MLGEVIFEEKGTTTGVRVLSADAAATKVEVTLQTEGTIGGVAQSSLWTYWSETRADGSIHGDGSGFMTTKDGDVIAMKGSGVGARAADGSVAYRGSIYFHTSSSKFSHLNTIAGVHEYDVDADGNTAAKVWEWK